MKQYLDLCRNVLENGVLKEPARPGMPRTLSLNSVMVKYDLSDGFPLLTTKKMYTKGIFTELLWLLRGESNISYLLQHDCKVWVDDTFKYYNKRLKQGIRMKRLDKSNWIEWCKNNPDSKEGEMGKIYPYQWRNRKRDQVVWVLNNIKNNPNSRYHIIEGWNVDDIEDGDLALPPCHKTMQFFVRGEYLDMNFYVRSNDLPLGNPWNVPCYATILILFSKITGYKPGILTYFGGDVHIYENQINAIKYQLEREPFPLPQLEIDMPDPNDYWIDNNFNFDAFIQQLEPSSFKVLNYMHYSKILMPLSVGI